MGSKLQTTGRRGNWQQTLVPPAAHSGTRCRIRAGSARSHEDSRCLPCGIIGPSFEDGPTPSTKPRQPGTHHSGNAVISSTTSLGTPAATRRRAPGRTSGPAASWRAALLGIHATVSGGNLWLYATVWGYRPQFPMDCLVCYAWPATSWAAVNRSRACSSPIRTSIPGSGRWARIRTPLPASTSSTASLMMAG